jgi:hypothetical protein
LNQQTLTFVKNEQLGDSLEDSLDNIQECSDVSSQLNKTDFMQAFDEFKQQKIESLELIAQNK